LKAITRFVASPQFVMYFVPKRTRLPLPPSLVRGGGWISAGMISTVHAPLPIFAQTDPKI
jgi:hypothetical protein